MKTDGEANSRKNTAVELTFMVKAFTQNGGNYWVLMNSYCRKMLFSFSYTDHDQNSIYGDMPYLAKQRIGFGQLTWDKEINNHDLLFWDCPPLPILR
jgi:hypothetical protein